MHLAGRTYDEVVRTFRWEIPERFNIAAAISDRHAASHPNRMILTVERADGTEVRYTNRDLNGHANRLAHALSAMGIGPGTIAAVHLPQGAESIVAHVAIQKTGAIALPLFNLFGPDAVRYRLIDSGARVLISSVGGLERLAGDLGGIETLRHVLAVGPHGRGSPGPLGAVDFWETVWRARDTPVTADSGPNDPALLMYTSGTTGQPKGVLHAGRTLLGHLPGVITWNDFFPQPGDRYWTPADWAWAGGLLDVMLPSLYFGVPLLAAERQKFDPEWAFDFIARHEVRNCFLAATALRIMRGVPNPRARFPTRLRSLGSGGESVGRDLIDWGMEAFGITIAEFYGQTEVNLVVGNCPSLFEPRPGSMGRAVPGHEVAVVDGDGNVVPDGTAGVIAVKRPDPVMFLEYWKRPEATADKFRGDWCLLGDVATRDADGFFWYQGRDDDLINSAGYRIGPTEVEDCLAGHPAVALAGVIGSPDPVRGEIVAAFIVPKAGIEPSDALAADIQAFVKDRLAAHEYPRKVRFIAEMPTTVTGKVRRLDLRKMDRDG
jgi:acetyl-CoA synthetase